MPLPIPDNDDQNQVPVNWCGTGNPLPVVEYNGGEWTCGTPYASKMLIPTKNERADVVEITWDEVLPHHVLNTTVVATDLPYDQATAEANGAALARPTVYNR